MLVLHMCVHGRIAEVGAIANLALEIPAGWFIAGPAFLPRKNILLIHHHSEFDYLIPSHTIR